MFSVRLRIEAGFGLGLTGTDLAPNEKLTVWTPTYLDMGNERSSQRMNQCDKTLRQTS